MIGCHTARRSATILGAHDAPPRPGSQCLFSGSLAARPVPRERAHLVIYLRALFTARAAGLGPGAPIARRRRLQPHPKLNGPRLSIELVIRLCERQVGTDDPHNRRPQPRRPRRPLFRPRRIASFNICTPPHPRLPVATALRDCVDSRITAAAAEEIDSCWLPGPRPLATWLLLS